VARASNACTLRENLTKYLPCQQNWHGKTGSVGPGVQGRRKAPGGARQQCLTERGARPQCLHRENQIAGLKAELNVQHGSTEMPDFPQPPQHD
jgi:hypothetical protein